MISKLLFLGQINIEKFKSIQDVSRGHINHNLYVKKLEYWYNIQLYCCMHTMLATQKRMKYILAAQLVVVTNPSIMTNQLLTTISSYSVTIYMIKKVDACIKQHIICEYQKLRIKIQSYSASTH